MSKDPNAAFTNRLQTADAVFTAVSALPTTPFAAVPTGGTASFNGVSGVVFFAPSGEQYLLLGDAAIFANFQSRALSGTLDNFYGAAVPVAGAPLDASKYSGSLAISSGVISSFGNNFSANLGGQLTAPGTILDINGNIVGFFKGVPVSAVDGDTGYPGGFVNGTMNGQSLGGLAVGFAAQGG